MARLFLYLLCSGLVMHAMAQKKQIYHPEADALKDIEAALVKAKNEQKFVLLQGGGNWCGWCIEFHRFCTSDPQIDSLIQKNFIWYHLNYSKENKNLPVFEKYGYPQRFGFPVFLVLNEKGERLHTQDSGYLEDGKTSYDKEKVMRFLQSWSPDAFNAEHYK
jgi:thioredoxin-related protein